MIIPMFSGAAGSGGGGSYLQVYAQELGGKYLKISNTSGDLYTQTVPDGVTCITLAIDTAGVYTVSAYASQSDTTALSTKAVNVTSLNANYSVDITSEEYLQDEEDKSHVYDWVISIDTEGTDSYAYNNERISNAILKHGLNIAMSSTFTAGMFAVAKTNEREEFGACLTAFDKKDHSNIKVVNDAFIDESAFDCIVRIRSVFINIGKWLRDDGISGRKTEIIDQTEYVLENVCKLWNVTDSTTNDGNGWSFDDDGNIIKKLDGWVLIFAQLPKEGKGNFDAYVSEISNVYLECTSSSNTVRSNNSSYKVGNINWYSGNTVTSKISINNGNSYWSYNCMLAKNPTITYRHTTAHGFYGSNIKCLLQKGEQ